MLILSLNSIKLEAPLNQTGESLILTELVLPRNAIARKTALKSFRLTAGKRSLVRAPFYETGLLKEKVDGPFGIKVSATTPMRNAELRRFLRGLLATGFESSMDLLSPVLAAATGASILDDLADAAADRVVDSIADETPAFVAVGGIDLESDTLENGKIAIPLKLAESMRRSNQPPGPKSREKRRSNSKLYRKGSAVGEVKLELRVE
ncbi:MAG: hypothetical protein GVY36_08680 [Verrucomicrobia bacterium]|jgi:hypothetical protein|nr:hypothetical protein [Verrucomicrobiota bacterium]